MPDFLLFREILDVKKAFSKDEGPYFIKIMNSFSKFYKKSGKNCDYRLQYESNFALKAKINQLID